MKNKCSDRLIFLVAADIGLQIPQLVNNVKVRDQHYAQDERPSVPSYTR